MPRTEQYLRPKKDDLLVPMGRKQKPESASEVTAGMKAGEKRAGRTGGKPDPVIEEPEVLDAEGVEQKRLFQAILTKTILPNSLSSKSTPEADKRSLVNKLNRRTLRELRGLIPDRIKRMSNEKLEKILDGTEEMLDEEKVEIQTLYMEVSP